MHGGHPTTTSHDGAREGIWAEGDELFTRAGNAIKNGFGSDTDEIGSECHLLPHFNPDTNANADLIEYEYKTDSSNTDSNPDTFSIWNIKLSRVLVYFVNNFIVDQNHYTNRE